MRVLLATVICTGFGLLSGYLNTVAMAYAYNMRWLASAFFLVGFTVALLLSESLGLITVPIRSKQFIKFFGLVLIGYTLAGMVFGLTGMILSGLPFSFLDWDSVHHSTPPIFQVGSVVAAIFASTWATAALRVIRHTWEWDVFWFLLVATAGLVVAVFVEPLWIRRLMPAMDFGTFLLVGQAIFAAGIGYGIAKPVRARGV